MLECKTEKRNSQREHGLPMEQTRVTLAVNHNTSDTPANEFDVRSVLHVQVSLAAVNQIYVIHEATIVD